jgi:TfoX/Sxy family transcriptional regulator of competence genes
MKKMAFSEVLAGRVRKHLDSVPDLKIEEKKMFSGIAFLVNGKMCVNVSGENLMCRYDPKLDEVVAERVGYEPMIMRGRQLRGYCYVSEAGYKSKTDFEYWMKLCLDFNEKAKVAKRRSAKKSNKK